MADRKNRRARNWCPGPDELPALLPFPRPAADGGHIPALDGVRGLAIGLVLLTHGVDAALSPRSGAEQAVYNVARWGWVGVDLFFVLSGFLITGILLRSLGRPHYLRNFFARRALRILPLYYATVVGCLVLLPLLPWAPFDWLRRLAPHQGWFWLHLCNYFKIAGNGPPVGWLSTLWSLAVEEHFYLIWPFVVWVMAGRRLGWACAAGAVAVMVLRVAFAVAGFPGDYLYRGTLTRIDPLLMGALVAVLARAPGGLWRLVPAARGLLLLALMALAVQAVDRHGGSGRDNTWFGMTLQYSVVGLLFAALLVLVLEARPHTRLHRLFACPALRFLGKYSYAMYILNKPMFQLARWALPPGDWAVAGSQLPALAAYLLLGIGLTAAGALASWHLLEKHCLGLKRFFEAEKSLHGSRRAPHSPRPQQVA
jgi:peptidoglycan/LPS O-acetylase OafA/YrhL